MVSWSRPSEPPLFVERLEGVSSTVGSDFTLRAVVSGTGPLSFIWTRDGTELTDNDHFKSSVDNKCAILNVKDAQVSHGGTYVCEARNRAGLDQTQAQVQVSGWYLCLVFLFIWTSGSPGNRSRTIVYCGS